MSYWSMLRSLFRRRKAEVEMSEEIRLHLELQTERNIAAGMDPDEARYAARRMLMLAVALLACWLPARRAAKVDPMVALRAE